MKPLSLDERKAIMMSILCDIDDFCRKYHIKYTLGYGTLLGAVRHGGFIPWDDDADLLMPREDFNCFVKLYQNRNYELMYSPEISPKKFVVSGYAKLCDPSTRIDNGWSDSNHGVFVDIFPLDYMPADNKECLYHMHALMRFTNRMYHRGRKDILSKIKSYRHSMQWWWNRHLEETAKYTSANSSILAHALGAPNYRTILDVNRFNNLTEISFEGKNFYSLSDPHSYLRMVYGEDYMTPPPPEKRFDHGDTFYKIDDQ